MSPGTAEGGRQAARDEPASVASASGTGLSGPARPSGRGPANHQPREWPARAPARPRTHFDRARREEAKTDDDWAAPRADWPRSLPRLTPRAHSGPGPAAAAAAAGSRPRGRAARARRLAEARAPRSTARAESRASASCRTGPARRGRRMRRTPPPGSAARSRGGRRAGLVEGPGLRGRGCGRGSPALGGRGAALRNSGAGGRDASRSPNRKRGGSGRPGGRPSGSAPASEPPASGVAEAWPLTCPGSTLGLVAAAS